MDVETEALTLGWTPKEQFRGDPDRWIDAEAYVARGKEIMPILKKNNEKLLGDVESLKGTVTNLTTALTEAKESMEEFRKYHNETSKREYEKAVKDLKAQKVVALREGEHESVVEIDEALVELNANAPKELKAAPTPPPPPPSSGPHPDYVGWERDNSEWLKDPEKQAYASSIANYLRAMDKTTVGRPFLDKVTAEVEKRFAGPPPASKVEGGQPNSRRSGHSFTDLPAEAKAACDRMGGKLVGANRAFKSLDDWRKEYISKYDWS
jgi:soluble cytochrome b562